MKLNPIISLMKNCELKLIYTEVCGWVVGFKIKQRHPVNYEKAGLLYDDEINQVQTIGNSRVFLTEKQIKQFVDEKQSKQFLDNFFVHGRQMGQTRKTTDYVLDNLVWGGPFPSEKKETLSDKKNMYNPNFINFFKLEDVKEKIKEFLDWAKEPSRIMWVNHPEGREIIINQKAKEIFGGDLV